MIKSKAEYKRLEIELEALKKELLDQSKQLEKKKIPEGTIPHLLSFLHSRIADIQKELLFFNNIDQSIDFKFPLRQLGKHLVAFRLKKKIPQKEFANLLDVAESQVSRDEGNEYSGISLDRACSIIEALGLDVQCSVSYVETKSIRLTHSPSFDNCENFPQVLETSGDFYLPRRA